MKLPWVLRLTLLVPDIVETILDGKQGMEVTLAQVLESFPVGWDQQRQQLIPKNSMLSVTNSRPRPH